MREINKNLDVAKIQRIDLKADKPEKIDNNLTSALGDFEEPSVQDFSNPKAETLGRSQVSKTDNLESDVAFAMANPKAIENADKFFDIAFKSLQNDGDPDAYEKAASMTDIFTRKEQFLNK